MAFNGVRDFSQALEKSGDLVRVKREVDWDGEAAAIVRLTNELQGPAPFFEKVKGYPPGYRIFGTPLGTYRRLAVAMGLPAGTPLRELQAEYEKRMAQPLKPMILKDGPCKEVILKGGDVDLYRLPTTMNMEGEDARYLGTWDLIAVKDPDSDWTNWGMYRARIHNKSLLGIALHIANDGGFIYYRKYEPLKKPMPIAIVVGVDPLCNVAAISPFRIGESEVDFAGGFRREPVPLVKCETSDILVPAHAEIVVEGEMLPGVTVPHNPFGEFAGYMAPPGYYPACRVKAITFRKDPIFTVGHPGTPVYDGSICSCMTLAVAHKRHLREHGVPVIDVHVPAEGGQHLMIVSVKGQRSFTPAQIQLASASNPMWQQKVLVMEEDADIFNLSNVLFHFATRCNPERGIRVEKNVYGGRLTPNLSMEEKKYNRGSSALFDCTWPVEWDRERDVPRIANFEKRYTRELKEKVLKNWKSYGFTQEIPASYQESLKKEK